MVLVVFLVKRAWINVLYFLIRCSFHLHCMVVYVFFDKVKFPSTLHGMP